MKLFTFLLGILFLLYFNQGFSQKLNDHSIYFRSGISKPAGNIDSFSAGNYFKARKSIAGQSFLVLQFVQIPGAKEKQILRSEGIELMEYIPQKAYLSRVRGPFSIQMLKLAGVEAILDIGPKQKMPPEFARTLMESEPKKIWVEFFEGFPYDSAILSLKREGFLHLAEINRESNLAEVQLNKNELELLASLPAVKFIYNPPPPYVALEEDTRDNERANILQNPLAGGYDLTGEGVTVGVLEFVAPQHHVDFADRLVEKNTAFPDVANTLHATHVHGIVGGAGLINELYTGYAPKARLISLGTTSVVTDERKYFRDYQTVITNNSWGFGTDCNDTAFYYPGSSMMDKLAIDLPYIQNVFAAGNSGGHTCLLSPPGFHTVLSAHQSAKSTICVGNVTSTGLISGSSSRGPTNDGRIKPEIVATGVNVVSTVPTNTYAFNSGTSMASPAVAGGLALLYQEYRRRNGNSDPKSGLMKNIICNTATDLGNPGPDFVYGFGLMNLLRAVAVIDSNHYITGQSTQHSTNTHRVHVPSNTARLKVMLYWQDPPGSIFASRNLVNDLDLQVITPSSTTVLPYILDTVPANLNNPATRGEDHINNIEQVVIDHPEAGDYIFQVNGTEIAVSDQQEYYLSYDIVQNEIKLTYPSGGAKLAPGETATIQWDSWGNDNSTFNLRFSADNGIHWQNIVNNLTPDLRQFNWRTPDTVADHAIFQIIRNADGFTSNSEPFIILNIPDVSLSANQCPGYINIKWPAVHGATDYLVSMLDHGEMKTVDTITDTLYHFKNLSEQNIYWVSVSARLHGNAGLRAAAISRIPNDGNCADPVSDGDLKADTLVSPLFGRKFTLSALGPAETIRFRIKNLDDQPKTGCTVKYSVDGGPWVTESLTATIPADSSYVYGFSTLHDFSDTGYHKIKLVVFDSGDGNHGNDTVQFMTRQAGNAALTLFSGFTDDFETYPDSVYFQSENGLAGTSRFDFINHSSQIKLTAAQDVIDLAPDKALWLGYIDFTKSYVDSNNASLVATYNLSSFDTASNDIGLNFIYSKSGTEVRYQDSLYIRGSEKDPWIGVMNLDDTTAYQYSNRKINIYGLNRWLKPAKQNYSSSFQASWVKVSAGIIYLLDQVSIYDQSNDIELKSLDSLRSSSYNLGKSEPIFITVRNNTKNPVNNLPVHFRIDGGDIITESIPLILPDSVLSYSFIS